MDENEKHILTELMFWASRRERSPKELSKKLHNKELKDNVKQEICDVLSEQGFLDEKRFADAFVIDKFRFNQWGRYRLRLELRSQGIPAHLIEESLLRIPEDEYIAAIDKLLGDKLSRLHKESRLSTLHKITTFVIRKGFEPALVLERAEKIIETI